MIPSPEVDIHPRNQYRLSSDMKASKFWLPTHSCCRKLPEDSSTKWGSKPKWHKVADPAQKRSEGEFRMWTVAWGASWRPAQLSADGDLLAKLSGTCQKDTFVNTAQRHLNIWDVVVSEKVKTTQDTQKIRKAQSEKDRWVTVEAWAAHAQA